MSLLKIFAKKIFLVTLGIPSEFFIRKLESGKFWQIQWNVSFLIIHKFSSLKWAQFIWLNYTYSDHEVLLKFEIGIPKNMM